MAKYCVYCGKPLKADGRCPNCSADPGGASGKKPKKKRRTLMIVLITASALLLSAKRNHCGGILAEERIDHRRMRRPSPPCEFGLDGCRRNCR